MMSTPVTPQRIHRPAHSHSVSHSFRSPNSPASPYTPLSLRSFASSNPSPLTTPASVKNLRFNSHHLTSPLVYKQKSYADVAQNWRSRATENGIKVGDDETCEQFFSDANDAGIVTTEEALLSPAFVSTRRRRAVSQSQVILPPANLPSTPARRAHPTSPLVSRSHPLATPPPNRVLAAQHKLKGSLTDPPKPRKREAFAVIPQHSPNVSMVSNSDVSLELFDIDENDYEYDEYEHVGDLSHYDLSRSEKIQEYAPYPLLSNTAPSPMLPSFGQPTFSDPFISGLGAGYPANHPLAEGHFHQYNTYQPRPEYLQPQPQMLSMLTPSIASVSNPLHMFNDPAATSTPPPQDPPNACTVCSRVNPDRLAVLVPCNHPLCSACLTSALNIVGEKDMECAVCRASVEDFKLITPPVSSEKEKKRTPFGNVDVNLSVAATTTKTRKPKDGESARPDSFFDPLFSSPGSATSGGGFTGLDNAFEYLGAFDEAIDTVRCSTPLCQKRSSLSSEAKEPVVLRIDNVPWDITPPGIVAWLQQPIIRAHVLLDKKGKTLSHAFVEVFSEDVAGAILRGEASNSTTGRGDIGAIKKGRGTVLGRGRRARGVTVTRSSQEELMTALFPSWRGSYDGSRPTLAGLDNGRVVGALESGLLTDSEVTTILYLVRSPDAHFLKVPSLPFYVLISILNKFPSDIDSRVFWSGHLRDSLYDVTYAAIQVLLNRIEEENSNTTGGNEVGEYSKDLVDELIKAGVQCQAFTTQQASKLLEFSENDSSSTDADVEEAHEELEEDQADAGDSSRTNTPSSTAVASVASAPEQHDNHDNNVHDHDNNGDNAVHVDETTQQNEALASGNSIGDLAREFGIEAHLVQALAERLALR